jgi:hypothetical protein
VQSALKLSINNGAHTLAHSLKRAHTPTTRSSICILSADMETYQTPITIIRPATAMKNPFSSCKDQSTSGHYISPFSSTRVLPYIRGTADTVEQSMGCDNKNLFVST